MTSEVFVLAIVIIVQFIINWTLYRRLVETRKRLNDVTEHHDED